MEGMLCRRLLHPWEGAIVPSMVLGAGRVDHRLVSEYHHGDQNRHRISVDCDDERAWSSDLEVFRFPSRATGGTCGGGEQFRYQASDGYACV